LGNKRRGGPRSGFGKRVPPPDTTWAEARYIIEHKEAETPMVVSLVGGEVVRGTIEYYDRDMIKIIPADAPGRFVWKKDIRYMHAADDEPAAGD